MLARRMPARIHPSSVVSEKAEIGDGTQIWLFCQIREDVRIGTGCVFGKNVYVDAGVTIGNNVKIQNNVSVFAGVTIEDGVFCGPHVCFTNDKVPRAVNPDLSLKGAQDWVISKTLVKAGAALGANSTIVCGTTIGRWAMVGSGAVVTKDVPDHGLVLGNPAKLVGWVCACGQRVTLDEASGTATCTCGKKLVKEGKGLRLA
jgi:UDP-2-acetamido-3-amino-2,3-dideoxy-glucuronate N-acetyltransferase